MILTKQLEEIAERIAAVPVFGVDISDESIKYIRFQSKRSGYVLRDHGVLPLDPGVVVNGEIKNEVALATVLKHAPFSRGFGVGTFVVASLPEEKSFVRIAQIPHVKSAQLRNAVLWELADTLPLPLEEVYFDYEVVPEPHPKDHLDVLTITFPRVVVDTYLRAFRAAGIIPMAFELESQAIARALSDRSRVLEPSLIIDIGKNRSSFVLMYNGSIALTSTIPFSGTVMHQALAKELSVDIGAAEALKKEAGLRTDLHEGKVATVLSNALSPLVDEIEKHTEYYRDHLAPRDGSAADIAKVICTGGDAALLGLDSYLAKLIHKPILIGNPFIVLGDMLKEPVPFSKNEALQFSTAVGLAVRSIDL